PFYIDPQEGSAISRVAVLSEYSVQAWAELVYPGRSLRFSSKDQSIAPAGPREILVLWQPRPGKDPRNTSGN
ncbi:MAG: hypothetical protein KJ645_06325, partial [Planctomycetes bacterium]|nr:hypothetical protein [Planctomycetota bacterium]